jgi:putative ABC transport system permease protein
MLRNYFKVALRNLWRYKGFSLINILGLTIGIVGCLVIGLFVNDELKFDKFINDGDNIYRVYLKTTTSSGTTSSANTPPVFAPYMQQHYPEVASTTRLLMWSGKKLMEAGDERGYEEKGFIADSTFFEMFPLEFVKGDSRHGLEGRLSIVISDQLAKKYFKKTDPVGQVIKLDKVDFIVRGVFAPLPEHFHLDFNYMLSIASADLPSDRLERWGWQQFFTYVRLKPNSDVNLLQNKFHTAVIKEAHPQTKEHGFTFLPYFQPLKNIHLGSAAFAYDNAKRGNETYVKGLTVIALFVLIIACFNFINLATARSFRRAKEIGLRKVVGADRSQLVVQYTAETIFLALIAIMLATIATVFIIPYLNNFTGKSIRFNPFTDPLLGLALVAFAVLIGFLSGLYPALVMSGFQPIRVLKGLKPTKNANTSSGTIRQALVIGQFALSAFLIVSTVIVYRQINFLHQKDLGFSKDQLLYFDVRGGVASNSQVFKDELKSFPGVIGVTGGYGLPGDAVAGDGITVPGKDGDQSYSAVQLIVDYDYIRTMDLKIIAGRSFSKDFATDAEEAFIINETAVRELGFRSPEKALGQRLNWDKWIPDSINPVKKGKVIGVVKDFHVKSLHEKLSTTVLQIYPPVLEKMAVKVSTENLAATINSIKSVWNRLAPDYPFDYKFLDENFAVMYSQEDKLSTLLLVFTGMAVFVGCMGLFGLTAFAAEQRVKEIGIRKVLGASVAGIVTMLCGSFLRPVIIAFIIAFPLSWWIMNGWLQDFPYRVSISWVVYLVAAFTALAIALVTISFQSIRAATADPVKNLRTE